MFTAAPRTNGLGVGPDGSLYIATGSSGAAPGQIYRRTPSGQVDLLAGVANGGSCETPRVDGKVDPRAAICPTSMTVAPDGSVLFGDTEFAPQGGGPTSGGSPRMDS